MLENIIIISVIKPTATENLFYTYKKSYIMEAEFSHLLLWITSEPQINGDTVVTSPSLSVSLDVNHCKKHIFKECVWMSCNGIPHIRSYVKIGQLVPKLKRGPMGSDAQTHRHETWWSNKPTFPPLKKKSTLKMEIHARRESTQQTLLLIQKFLGHLKTANTKYLAYVHSRLKLTAKLRNVN